MLTFFRRGLSSWLILGILALVMVAFIITGVERPGIGGGSGAGPVIAKAGGHRITAAELLRREQNQFDNARREQPTLTHQNFVASGLFDKVADLLISTRALESWATDQGFAVSKRLVDARIATLPAFFGPTGKFDEQVMRAQLAQARISEKDLRDDIANDVLRGQILVPTTGGIPVGQSFTRPYAELLLEKRVGSVGILPLAAFVDPRAPAEPELAAAYRANIAAYTRPEARALRYALFGHAQVAARAVPTETEIAEYYRDHASDYAARELRTLAQVIVADEAAARSTAAAVRAGTPLAAAAAKIGLEATTIAGKSRADYAALANPAIAAAAYGAPKGAVVGPIKGAFGWYVLRVDAITGTPARSLAEARPEIVAAVTKQKSEDALSELAGKIEDAIADGASFAEVATANRLTVVETPPLLPSGKPIDRPEWKAPPEVAALLRTAFALDADDRPSVETVTPDQQFALVSIARIVPPSPVPLAQVRDAVLRDLVVKRATARAKAAGEQIVAKVNRGVPLTKALAETGVTLPAPQPAAATELDIARAQQAGAQVPEALQALFSLRPGKAKLTSGRPDALFVATLSAITPGAVVPQLVDARRAELSQGMSTELGGQFVRAIEQEAKVARYPDAIAAARRQFSGQ